MSHALDEALDALNHHHTFDCAAVESVDADCNCDDGEAPCAA